MQILVEYKRRHKMNNQSSQIDNQFLSEEARLVSVIGIVISAFIILFAWFFPAEKKDAGINLAILFVGHMNIYVLMPAIAAMKNENIRSYLRQRQICFRLPNISTNQANAVSVISHNQVNPI